MNNEMELALAEKLKEIELKTKNLPAINEALKPIIASLFDDLKKLPATPEKYKPIIDSLFEIITNTLSVNENLQQRELFPLFKPTNTVNLKKDVVVSWVSTTKIKEQYPHLLNLTLAGDKKTLSQLLDEVENWYKDLRGEDYGNWIKVFLFARAVKDQLINEPDTVDLFEDNNGRYTFFINTDKRFYEFFEKPKGNKPNGTKYYTDGQKDKIIAWLEKNNDAIEFPIIASLPSNKKAIIPKAGKVFCFKKALRDDGKQLLLFSIDTSVLDDEFNNYVSFSREDIDAIEEAWKEKNPKFESESLKSFVDIPLRFLSRLKTLYSREAVTTLEGGLVACVQTLSKENLDAGLGYLTERIQKTLISRNRIRTGKTSNKPKEIKKLILETTFKIATEMKPKWLFIMPGYKDGKYRFVMNPGFFDPKETAKILTERKSS
ncbi:MAG: hypothetical protein LBH43_09965 [Treponema sp.]|nr:hypothetical protein [Treponema sp.]